MISNFLKKEIEELFVIASGDMTHCENVGEITMWERQVAVRFKNVVVCLLRENEDLKKSLSNFGADANPDFYKDLIMVANQMCDKSYKNGYKAALQYETKKEGK